VVWVAQIAYISRPVYSLLHSFLFSFPFFLFFGGKYENYAIYASGVCFELKFDRRVKNQSVPESVQRGIQSMPLLPPTVCPNGGQNAVRTGAEGAVA